MRAHSTIRLIVTTLVAAMVFASTLVLTANAGALTRSGQWRVTGQPPSGVSWYAATYAQGRFVVVGHGDKVATSTNGVSWSAHDAPAGGWQSVAYGAGRFVALSVVDARASEMTSRDGVHWSALAGPLGEWTGLTYGDGRFVAVSALGQFATSLDGLHWTITWTRSQFLLNSVTYGDGRFVAVDSADGDALISLDGQHWSFYTISSAGTPWFAVTYGNGVFSTFSPRGLVATSTLGYVWQIQSTRAQQMNASTFGCNTVVATGQATGRVNNVLTSTRGASWVATPVPTDTQADWTAVTYGSGRFVAVDTAGRIATLSVSGYCGATVATPPRDVSGNVASGQVWTYQHPPANQGGAPVDGYLVTVSDAHHSWTCHAPVYYQPNCIVRGLSNHQVYYVSTRVHNRFGYSAPSDPEWVIPVSQWSLEAYLAPSTTTTLEVQVTGVIANSEGIYPQSPLTLHVGGAQYVCVPSPFGECVFHVARPPQAHLAIWASYTGYGVSYRSPTIYANP
ncbi:MAG: fibronectin type III domain-containing protein [Acidobacteriota bacterium]|nr:fibronectin type III domain-containing protein [Acidobacteriota bacterium]